MARRAYDLFEGRRQLIVYRAFFEPGVFGWYDYPCRGCSLDADQVSNLAHLNARDTALVYASRAPHGDIARLKARMGWKIPRYSITTVSMRISASPTITATTSSFGTASASSAPISSTGAATRRSGRCGAISTSRHSAARRIGKICRRVTRIPRHTSGGTGTTTTAPRDTQSEMGRGVRRRNRRLQRAERNGKAKRWALPEIASYINIKSPCPLSSAP